MERMDRRWAPISMEQIEELSRRTGPDDYAADWMTDTASFTFAEALIGRTLIFRMEDGSTFAYTFEQPKRVRYRLQNGVERTSFYRAIPEPGHPDIIFLHQYLDGIVPASCVTAALDLTTGYCTFILARLGQRLHAPREVTRQILFG